MSHSKASSETEAGPAAPARTGGFRVWWELTKPRLALMSTLTAAIGYIAAPVGVSWVGLCLLVISIFLSAGGVLTLNQWWERAVDGLMERTRARPLPTGRVSIVGAGWFGLVLVLAGLLIQWWAFHPLALFLNFITVTSYLLLYTPLKRVSLYCTHVGALPGALPPLIGWSAATGTVDGLGFWLFMIVLLWQMPHFFAISWMFREDYARGGIRVLSVTHPNGRRLILETVLFSILLGIVTLWLFFADYAGWAYLFVAVVLFIWLIFENYRFAKEVLHGEGKSRLFLFSLLYLPVLLVALLLG